MTSQNPSATVAQPKLTSPMLARTLVPGFPLRTAPADSAVRTAAVNTHSAPFEAERQNRRTTLDPLVA